uniref:hypothetical protein n=1 Tax=Streptomyces cellulosae TaxID=1968 RepID=UPI002ED4DEAC
MGLCSGSPTSWVPALQLDLHEIDALSELQHAPGLSPLQPQGSNDVLRQTPAWQSRATSDDDLPAAQPFGDSARIDVPPYTQLREPARKLLLLHAGRTAEVLDLLGPFVQCITKLVDQFFVRASQRGRPSLLHVDTRIRRSQR